MENLIIVNYCLCHCHDMFETNCTFSQTDHDDDENFVLTRLGFCGTFLICASYYLLSSSHFVDYIYIVLDKDEVMNAEFLGYFSHKK